MILLLQQPTWDSLASDSQTTTACGGASAASTQGLFYRIYSSCNNPHDNLRFIYSFVIYSFVIYSFVLFIPFIYSFYLFLLFIPFIYSFYLFFLFILFYLFFFIYSFLFDPENNCWIITTHQTSRSASLPRCATSFVPDHSALHQLSAPPTAPLPRCATSFLYYVCDSTWIRFHVRASQCTCCCSCSY